MSVDGGALAPRVLVPLRIDGEPPALGQRVHALAGETMGTTWSVRFVGPASLRLATIESAIVQVCDRVIAEMSQWVPDSEISRFNRAPAGTMHRLSPGFARVIDAALHIAAVSHGAYDPTAGALVALWGFGPSGPTALSPRHDAPGFRPPSAAECAGAHCGWSSLTWDTSACRLTQPGGATLDLSAIAKGHAVDQVSAVLASLGLRDHLVEIGGELRGAGLKPEGQPWWVDLEPPSNDCGLAPVRMALHGLAVATSGDYRKCFDDDGQRRSHTVDPRTRRPVTHGLASVTVVHEQAMWADGWSTALMVLGPDAGLDLANQLGLAALLVRRRDASEGGGFEEQFSASMRELMV
ncbi:FAD:protein FMN transferase [Roseateles amylovorans]|uniref:FAD:protein FMN transferase n=1 Tax=Roseateles amylovorans TaxID=2978473 RepID=A0ABY6AZ29_9BURK|nr:FAD:protein FMN transferase [Roseateles amylovorans]UXH78173.1 FAD:protein FMN transferase [Roseateles amylovorans]